MYHYYHYRIQIVLILEWLQLLLEVLNEGKKSRYRIFEIFILLLKPPSIATLSKSSIGIDRIDS
jgi:hypothetical protein